jgi:hypothetical protein
MTASAFFVYDTNIQRLRLKVHTEYQQTPGLLKRLYKDILQYQTVKLDPQLWSYILEQASPSSPASPVTTITAQLQAEIGWQSYSSRWFRLSSYSSPFTLNPQMISRFWKCPMLLQARSLWYRTLIGKLPTKSVLFSMGIGDSPYCRLCSGVLETENQFHVQIGCPTRWHIWTHALAIYYPDLDFDEDDIHSTLRLSSAPPPSILNVNRYFTIISTIHWIIWRSYWNLVFHDTPMKPSAIITNIITQSNILLPSLSHSL